MRLLQNQFGYRRGIRINTVDGFQGQEREIIIFNCVRSNKSGTLGFLQDLRRLNVSVTRPRFFLFVIGNSRTLEKDKVWGALIDQCKKDNMSYLAQMQTPSNPLEIINGMSKVSKVVEKAVASDQEVKTEFIDFE